MKRHHIIPSLAALTLAFALPAMSWATNTASAAKSTTASKSGTTAKSTSATTTHAKSTSSTSAKTSTTHHTSSTSAKAHKIDLNTASREQLMTLPGVDGAMADKIISERPYKNMNELTSKKVVSKEEYNKIKNHVTAKQSTAHSEAPASPGNSGMATQNGGSSDQNPTDQTTK